MFLLPFDCLLTHLSLAERLESLRGLQELRLSQTVKALDSALSVILVCVIIECGLRLFPAALFNTFIELQIWKLYACIEGKQWGATDQCFGKIQNK